MAGLYELLGLDLGASPDQIRAAITSQRRIWRRRTTSPDITVRQEAERRMQQLDEAERNLTDPLRRARYNAELDADSDHVSPPSVEEVEAASARGTSANSDDVARSKPSAATGNPIARAVEQISRNQHGVAAFTARKAVDEDPDNPYAWSVLAQATSAAGDHVTAVEAIERALGLDPEDARLHAQRGAILRAAGEPARALAAYQAAASLDENEPEYQVAFIEQLMVSGEVDQAISVAQEGYRAKPDEGSTRIALARALAERARLAQHELADSALVITTAAQARYVESLANRGLSVNPPEPSVRTDLARHRDYARKALRRRFSFSAIKANYRWPLGLGALAASVMCCFPAVFRDNTDMIMRGVISIAVLGGLALFAGAVVRNCFVPQYQRNAEVIEHAEPRRMAKLPKTAEPSTPTNSKAMLSRK